MADPFAKRSSGEENDRIKYGTFCMRGNRNAMQDAHTAILDLDGSDSTSFFGVFHGHGGDKVALYCSEQLHIELVKDPDYENNLPTAMENVYLRIDENLRRSDKFLKSQPLAKENLLRSPGTALCTSIRKNEAYIGPQGEGVTVCVALIRDNQITVANAGDSRCILSRDGQAIELSTDHKPDHPGESARTEATGGQVLTPETATMRDGQKVIERGVPRIDGKIAVSRALGDFDYKQNPELVPEGQKMICNPDIRTENITDDTDFLLIASEAIWHVKSNAQVANFVRSYLQAGETDLNLICERLTDWCMAPGDNSTVILVQFKSKTLDILEELWYEVLLRLPSKMILRCRSVCKPWRNITTTPEFLERHHGLQKPQSLIVPVDNSRNRRSCVHSVLAMNVQCPKDMFRPIIRCTTFGKYKARDNEDEEKRILSAVHASLDGMVLVSFDKTCYIINPITRKSSRLLPLYNAEKILGLYKHVSSGEYRVLYERASEEGDWEEEDGSDSEEEDESDSEEEDPEEGDSEEEDLESYCIISLGSQLTRSLQLTSAVCRRLAFAMDGQPPAVVGDRIYWPPSTLLDDITVFYSESEVFHWMKPPVKNTTDSIIKLIELNGQLAVSVSTRGASKVELFKLEDSHGNTWARYHIIELPIGELDSLWAGRTESYFVSLNGDILVEYVWRSCDGKERSPGQLLCCNQNGALRTLFQGYWGKSPILVLKESLTTQSFLSETDPALFEGL